MANESSLSSSEDFVISVDGTDIHCSKDVLAHTSDYFRALFDSQMQESVSNRVTVTDFSYEIVAKLVDCMNTGQLQIGNDVTELAQGGVRFQIPTAIQTCESYLLMTLDHTNCFSCLQLARALCLEELYSRAKRHSLYYFTSVVQEQEFLSLEMSELLHYLAEKQLNCESEVNILKAIDSWVNYDIDGRLKYLDKLLACFHGEDLLPSEWKCVLCHPLLLNTDQGLQWIRRNQEQQALSVPCHLLDLKQENETESGEEATDSSEGTCDGKSVTKYRELPLMFLTLGGCNDDETFCQEISKFDTENKAFKPFKNLCEIYDKPLERMGCRVCAIGKDLYITGGQSDLGKSQTHFMNVWKYDSFEDKWTVATTLPSPRRHHGACASRSCLYLMGGFGKYRMKLATFVEYDTINDKWQELPSMPYTCYKPDAVFCSNKIFVYKDTDVSCFDFSTLSWSLVFSRDIYTTHVLPCVFDRYIYEFPYSYLDDEEQEALFNFQRRKTDTEVVTCYRLPNETVEFGNNVVLANGRFYLLNLRNRNFVSWDPHNDRKVCVLGSGGTAGRYSTLLALVNYPQYKITNDP